MPALFPTLMVSFFAMSGDGDALVLQGDREVEHVVVDDLRPSAVVALGRGDDLAFEGLLPDVVALDLPGDRENIAPMPLGSEIPVSGPVRSSSWMPPAWSSADSVISSAAFLARRSSSCTVRMTDVSGAARGNRSAGTRISSSPRSAGTRTKRGVVLRGGPPAPGAAGAACGRVTVRAVVTFYRKCGLIGREIHTGDLSEVPHTTRRF
ncbi:hypothetical protein QP090_31895 [Actinomadura xylanilytica]|nr:hypothetical protein [Actinomadura xylanilytica]MDL4776781.1 hypothetical protein [Actinomadura xylanilytica]